MAKASYAPASVWRRFMSMVYEGLLLFGPLLLIAFIYSVSLDFNDTSSAGSLTAKRLGLQLVCAAALVAYFTWGWSNQRCTLPMQTLGLRVVDARDPSRKVKPRQALLRALIAVPSTLTGIGLLSALLNRDSQSLHDRFSNTRLVHIPINRRV
jgi:uncharacterized RDD family membrane protein YckC